MGHNGGPSKYQTVADELRRQIVTGILKPGDQIPSETELMKQFGVGKNTVRAAMVVLRSNQLVRTEPREGTFVADPSEAPMPWRATRAYSSELRAAYPMLSVFDQELAELGRVGSETLTVEELASAPAEVAELLGIGDGEAVVLRHRVQEPPAIVDSWCILSDVEGTEVVSKERITRGLTQALKELGLESVRRIDKVTAGPCTQPEADALRIPAGSTVLRIVATELAKDGRPVEVRVRTLPADRHVLVYEVDKTV
jgi:GntR family transcriptional regulator